MGKGNNMIPNAHFHKYWQRHVRTWFNQPSASEFSSPIVLANKKDGSKRLCVDYRLLNKQVVRDRFPIPLIEEQIDALQGAEVFTTLDLENGFFHVPVAENSRKFTSFITPSGQYEFLRMPFGLCTSPTVFQKFINKIFQPLVFRKYALVYMDDIIVPAKDEKEGLERLEEMLRTAAEYGLKIKWRKCQFLCRQIEYLGYDIGYGRVRPSNTKTIAIKRFPEPTNIRKLQSFLGLAGYFRKFVPDYAKIAKPLFDLLRKGTVFHFELIHRQAFQEIKSILSERPILAIYNPNAETELHTDASKFGFGAVLLQKNADDGKFHPVFYFSRRTTSVQERYSSYELEVLAIVAALKKLRVYLLGIPFKIVTDCAAFKMTMNKKELPPRISGWALHLQDFDFALEHRSGTKMKHVDALSREYCVMVLESDIVTRIKSSQLKDTQLKLITQIVQKEPFENYLLEGGVLYQVDDQGNKLLCVPRGMQTELVKSVHDLGHFAQKKMEEILKRDYSIPKLKNVIEACRRNCIPCILAERKHGKQDGLLNPIPKEDSPLETYHVDHLGPLTATKKGYRYILTVVDGFSKFVWIYPTKTLTASEVIEKLELQKSTFGNPKRIISDRGTAFTSNMFRQYCEEENIHHTLTTTGVPRGNGQVERTHRTIISALAKLSLQNPEEWYKFTNKVQRYLNSTWQRSIKKTPFEVLFGTKIRIPEELRLAEAVQEGILEAFEEERDAIREHAKKSILEAQEENRKQFNKGRRQAPIYETGDLVAVKRTQFGNVLKIYPKYLGPYKVAQTFPNDRFEVEKIGEHEGPRRTIVSIDNM